MKRLIGIRPLLMLASGAVLLQGLGCTFTQFNEFAQTVLLGVTAAGSIAILQNI